MQSPRNTVTSQDVGKRASFQYELPNGYASEVVGRIEAFDEQANTFMVRNREGVVVRVPAHGVRFSKVIPS